LLKEPKYYLWDWSLCDDPGARAENFIASHLLKSIHFWNDYGYGEFGLWFLRDKSKREVDFVVTRNDKPWFLVEVKNSRHKGISQHLHYFHERLGTQHALQVVFNMPYVNKNCFESQNPLIVPARTFCSQLI